MHYKIQNRINLLLELAKKHKLIDDDVNLSTELNKIGLINKENNHGYKVWHLSPRTIDELTDYLILLICTI